MNTRRRCSRRPFFPSARINQVDVREVQQALLAVFRRWGQPQAIKVDNGRPFGDPASGLAPVLSLWLIGLGIDMIWNRPRQPTDNAKVERMQAVTHAWSEPETCRTLAVLQARLDAAIELQRTRYPVRRLGGRTRQAAYPGLCAGGKPYQAASFSLARVLRFLAGGSWVRKVSKVGQIYFYGQVWHVGAQYARQHVSLHLDAATRAWVVSDEAGCELTRIASDFLTARNLWALSLCQGTEGDRT